MTGNLGVPLQLRNSPTELMKELGHGKYYQYPHNNENNFIEMEFLPDKLKGQRFMNLEIIVKKLQMREFLKSRWKDKYGY